VSPLPGQRRHLTALSNSGAQVGSRPVSDEAHERKMQMLREMGMPVDRWRRRDQATGVAIVGYLVGGLLWTFGVVWWVVVPVMVVAAVAGMVAFHLSH
jgi:hypothetical protein